MVMKVSPECWSLDCKNCSQDDCPHICHKPRRTKPRPLDEDKWFDILEDAARDAAA
jgi:hypothetical protein